MSRVIRVGNWGGGGGLNPPVNPSMLTMIFTIIIPPIINNTFGL